MFSLLPVRIAPYGKAEAFQEKNGAWSPLDLQEFRTTLWISNLMTEHELLVGETGAWPSANLLYRNTIDRIQNTKP